MSRSFSTTLGCGWRVMLAAATLITPLRGLDPRKPITHYSHRVWDTADGLPQDSVRAITQTRDGYLWLGTQTGLARFDGEHFTVWDPSNSPLKHGHILALCAARDGSLWIGSGDLDGLYRWTSEQGVASIWSGANVRAIFEDRDGTVWAGTEGKGLLRISGRAPFRIETIPGLTDVRAIVRDRAGRLWIGSNGQGLSLYDRNTQSLNRQDAFPARISALWPDSDGSLWVGSKESGLIHRQGAKVRYLKIGDRQAGESILALLGDRDGNLWIGTDGAGISRYRNGNITNCGAGPGLSGDIVRAIFEDREGNIWMGTAGAGLNRFQDDPFVTYGRQDGLSNGLIWSMAEGDDGTVWIGTREGWLNRWKDGEITRFRLGSDGEHDSIVPLVTDRVGNLWAGIWSGGALRLRALRAQGKGPPAPAGIERTEAIRAVAKAPDGSIWLGADDGLVQFGTGRQRRVYRTSDGLPSNRILAIAFDHNGRTWVATAKGLATGGASGFQAVNSSPGMQDDSIQALLVDERNNLWLGSREEGLYQLRRGRLTHYTRSQGLPDNQVFSILEDGNRNLWLTCRKGIYRVSIEDFDRLDRGEISHAGAVIYESLDGLRASEINYDAKPPAMLTRDGRLWFATYGGVSVVDPAHLMLNYNKPPVYIERVNANGTEFPAGRDLTLGPANRNLEIHYTALSFRAPQRVKFRYRMEGFDRDWVDADDRRVAYYTNLPPGSYRFCVVACNGDGFWNYEGAGLALVLEPHLYECWWFWPVLAGCMGASGLYVLHRRARQFQARQTELARHVDQRTRELQAEIQVRRRAEEAAAAASRIKGEFLANMSHEIRTPMNGVVGMTQLALELSTDPEQQAYLNVVQSSADSLMGLLNDILDLSRIEAGKLTIEPIPFEPEALVRETVQLLEVNAREKGLGIRLDCASDLPRRILADPLRLRQVLMNLLGNAIKFTETGRIEVRLRLGDQPQTLRLAVRDTGIGIPRDKQEQVFAAFTQADGSITRKYGGSGLGLAISAKLVQLMGGTIRLQSEPGLGSLFEIDLPYRLSRVPEDADEPPVPVAPECALRPMRILLAEDNPVNQMVASRMLEKHGHSVVIAPTGEAAVGAARRESFDLILMDVQMPQMDGFEATATIRETERGDSRHVPIVAMTAHAMTGDRERCLAAGMDGYLAKPLRSGDLLQKLAEIQHRF